MFYKTVDPGSWSRMQEQGIVHQLPFLKSGHMTQTDRRSFFQKTAASEQFLHEISQTKMANGDIPVHLNAIGASEVFGANRKGDAFSMATCRACHPSFVREGRVYLHHDNRNPNENFGKIASSCYNDNMHRVELLVLANGNETAATRNGGKVLPEEFMDKLEKNAAVAVSMGCTIDGDVCSICGNFARTRREYCNETNCKDPKTGEYFPGCAHGLMKIAHDGRIQYVDNVNPRFFDISFVGTPADRTGYGYRATYLEGSNSKTASICDSYDFMGLTKTSGWTFRQEREAKDVLWKLAAYEQVIEKDPVESALAWSVYAEPQTHRIGEKLAALTPSSRISVINHMASQGVLLSPENFAVAFGRTVKEGDAMRVNLFGIYSKLAANGLQGTVKDAGDFLSAMDRYSGMKTASLVIPKDWFCGTPSTEAQASAMIGKGIYKTACHTNYDEEKTCDPMLAYVYAMVKIASLCRFPSDRREFGVKLAVWQNM